MQGNSASRPSESEPTRELFLERHQGSWVLDAGPTAVPPFIKIEPGRRLVLGSGRTPTSPSMTGR